MECPVEGCVASAKVKGMCRRHYLRLWRTGQTEVRSWSTGHLSVRLWRRVDRGALDACWVWTGPTNRKGYGTLTEGQGSKRHVLAHRAAWIATNGPIPGGLHVLHSCDNPPCCNPAHLHLGTIAQNNREMVERGRHWNAAKTHCKRGHEFTPENTLPNGRPGWRKCRECRRLEGVARRQDFKV